VLAFLLVPPIESELQILHRWLDTWTDIGLIAVGVERQSYRLSLSHIAEGELFLRDLLQLQGGELEELDGLLQQRRHDESLALP